MSKILKLTSETLIQSITDETISNSCTSKFKKYLKKVSVPLLVGLLTVSASGYANAFNLGSVVGMVTGATNPNQNMYEYKMSDVPQQCNDFSSYLLNSNTIPNTANVAQDTANRAQSLEENRLACAQQVYSSYNVNPPRYRQTVSLSSSSIMYEIVNRNTGENTFVTYGNSPAISAMNSFSSEGAPVESNPKLKQLLDQRSVNLIVAHENFNKMSRDFLNTAYGSDKPQYNRNGYDSNRQNAIYNMQQQLQNSYNLFAKSKAEFLSVADSATVAKYDVKPYSNVAKYLAQPESADLAFKGRLPNRYMSVVPGSFKY